MAQNLIKMYAIFPRETLRKMKVEGKLAAQAGHAYLHAWWDAEERLMDKSEEYARICNSYRYHNDARKISLVVDSVDELYELYDIYRLYMGASIVEDCAYTIFTEPTVTALGLGPIDDNFLEGSRLKSLDTLKNEISKISS